MLLKLPIQGVIGVNPPAQNAGSVRNTGFDLNVFHNYRLGKDLRYAVNLNLSYVHNKITDLKSRQQALLVYGRTSDWHVLWLCG